MNAIAEQRPSTVDWPDQFTRLPEIQDNGGLFLGNAVFYPEREKIAAFLDGPNVYATVKNLNQMLAHGAGQDYQTFVKDNKDALNVDYKLLLNLLMQLGVFTHASYYTAVHDEGFQTVRPLTDWLDYNGYRLVTKAAKTFTNERDGSQKVKGNMDCDLVVDVMTAIHDGDIDHVILFSGDGDFKSLLEACQKKQKRVTVVSTMLTKPIMIADELRRQASQFVDLYRIFPLIQKAQRGDDAATDTRPEFRPMHQRQFEQHD